MGDEAEVVQCPFKYLSLLLGLTVLYNYRVVHET